MPEYVFVGFNSFFPPSRSGFSGFSFLSFFFFVPELIPSQVIMLHSSHPAWPAPRPFMLTFLLAIFFFSCSLETNLTSLSYHQMNAFNEDFLHPQWLWQYVWLVLFSLWYVSFEHCFEMYPQSSVHVWNLEVVFSLYSQRHWFGY